jgi:ABC-type sugar transport system permease subunit
MQAFWHIALPLGALAVAAAVVRTISLGGRPGTIVVTLLYVFIGIAVQYILGLGLALLATQRLPGRRFFRVVFLLPMMITPVGIAYVFRMLTDTDKGPFQPIWQALGLGLYSWVNDPWGARAAVMIGDIWQWTPFMSIVLLAALEGQSIELIEAALVDGANRWQTFWHITLPQILPVSTTLILIRMIEAFKIVDMPNVLTNGGPGTATESLTLHAFFTWRALDLGVSAAIDDASRYRILWSIVLPLALPGLVANLLFVLVFAWNEYLLAVFLSSADSQTIRLTVAAQNATRGPPMVVYVGPDSDHDRPRHWNGHCPGALHCARVIGRRHQGLTSDYGFDTPTATQPKSGRLTWGLS